MCVNIHVQASQQLPCLLMHTLIVNESVTCHWLTSQENVLGDVQVRHIAQFLMDDGYAAVLGVGDITEMTCFPVKDYFTFIVGVYAREHIHQR